MDIIKILNQSRNIYEFYLNIEGNTLVQTYSSIFEKSHIKINHTYDYANLDDIKTDTYEIYLYKPSNIEHNSWNWARICTSLIFPYHSQIYISDKLWADIKKDNIDITSCSHTSDSDIVEKLSEQMSTADNLIHDFNSLDMDKPLKLQKILAYPDIYFLLAIEDKKAFNFVLQACEQDNFLLSKLSLFIHNYPDFNAEDKLMALESLEKVTLKNSLEKNLTDKNLPKKNKKI